MLASWIIFVGLATLMAFHLFVAPYTKVEESFNMQAIHDITLFGIPRSNVSEALQANYDHVTYPGSVPRTFIGALVLSGAITPFLNFLRITDHLETLQLTGTNQQNFGNP
jgi:alpha-1,6-mannosyltransferase